MKTREYIPFDLSTRIPLPHNNEYEELSINMITCKPVSATHMHIVVTECHIFVEVIKKSCIQLE